RDVSSKGMPLHPPLPARRPPRVQGDGGMRWFRKRGRKRGRTSRCSDQTVLTATPKPPAETSRGPRGLREGVVTDLGRLYRLRRKVFGILPLPPRPLQRLLHQHVLAGARLLTSAGAALDVGA